MHKLLILLLLFGGFSSCTNVSFNQINFGAKGVDFTKGTCLVHTLHAPTTKEGNIMLTSKTMKFLREICGDSSVIHMDSLRSTSTFSEKIPTDIDSGLIDSLAKYTSHYYFITITIQANAGNGRDISLNPSDFVDDMESEMYLNNRAGVLISVYEIQTHKLLYQQETSATESIDTESASLDDINSNSKRTMFTRSSLNIIKNALVRGLKDLRKYSKGTGIK